MTPYNKLLFTICLLFTYSFLWNISRDDVVFNQILVRFKLARYCYHGDVLIMLVASDQYSEPLRAGLLHNSFYIREITGNRLMQHNVGHH